MDENDKKALVGAPVRARDSDVLHYSLIPVRMIMTPLMELRIIVSSTSTWRRVKSA